MVDEVGVKLVIYLDDFFCFIFGLLCIMSCVEDFQVLIDVVFNELNGFCFCIGLFGVSCVNDLEGMMRWFGDWINFVYF